MRIGKPTAGNQCVSQVELITRSWSFFSRKRPERHMDRKFSRCARLRIWGSAPPDQGTPSRTIIPVTLEAASPPRANYAISAGAGRDGARLKPTHSLSVELAERAWVVALAKEAQPDRRGWRVGAALARARRRSALGRASGQQRVS